MVRALLSYLAAVVRLCFPPFVCVCVHLRAYVCVFSQVIIENISDCSLVFTSQTSGGSLVKCACKIQQDSFFLWGGGLST